MGKTRLRVVSEQESGIFVTQPFPLASDGEPQSVMLGRSHSANFVVSNGGQESVVLRAVRIAASGTLRGFHGLGFAASSTEASSSSRTLDVIRAIVLHPGQHVSFTITFTPKDVGFYAARILCDFDPPKWRVVQQIQSTGDNDISKELRPTAPYQKQERKRRPSHRTIVPGVSPPRPKFEVRLPSFEMPLNVRKSLESKNYPRLVLSPETYARYFKFLLYAEEFQMEFDIQAYDMTGVSMRKNQERLLVLRVVGLAERRPSIIYRDRIYVTPAGSDKEYEGHVHRVAADEVFLQFDTRFQSSYITGSLCDVRFSFSRTNLRRYHQALANLSPQVLSEFVFPSPVTPQASPPVRRLRAISHGTLNEEQTSAVGEIVAKTGASPYIVFGPPGTGKTVTVTEAILQVCRHNKDAVVLACAPSNNAADLILLRLVKFVEKRKLRRLNAYARSFVDVPPEVLEYSNASDGRLFADCPSRQELMSYQIIVTTFVSAALLNARGIRAGHFSHVFLDEAGQATEPEAMVPIINFAVPSTVVVLAGDHKQLGPVVRSSLADKLGLSRSFMERLTTTPPYTPPYRREMVTKLVKNYRSHPRILELPSRMFYDNELVPRAGDFVHSLCDWERLPNKKFPVLFIGVEGRDTREQGSPSWFNPQEVSKVIEVVTSLRNMRRNRPAASEIGIITPYRKQAQKIRASLSRLMLQDVKVGSVEQFQGQEKRAIIVSTVRSSPCLLEHDKKFDLGFLFNPKRFNVAVTRAQALLVVVGNPGILCKNEHWREFMSYCAQNKSYTGCSIPESDPREGTVEPDGLYVEVDMQGAEDQPWREAV